MATKHITVCDACGAEEPHRGGVRRTVEIMFTDINGNYRAALFSQCKPTNHESSTIPDFCDKCLREFIVKAAKEAL